MAPDPETEARTFALARHADQRYGHHPYEFHLAAVRATLADFGYGGVLGIAAWLHDLVEDTKTTREEIAQRFGEEVAALVWAVTGVGQSRSERNQDAFAKLRACPEAVVLKQADRIANASAPSDRREKLDRYRAEWPEFRAALAGLGDPRMWDRLLELLG